MTIFDRHGLRIALRDGVCSAPRLLTPLIEVSRSEYSRLVNSSQKTVHDYYEKVAERMPAECFSQVRMAADRALRCANDYFPAYFFHVGEFINDEWLSIVDWDGHRKFHRDHVLHQMLCVYVGGLILKGGDSDEFVFNGKTLLDWCIDAILYSPECSYLLEYLEEMGAPLIYLKKNRLSRTLWGHIIEEALFLATNYHDIGYPWQFVSKIQHQLDPRGPSLNPRDKGIDWIHDHYKDRLLLYPLRGYQPFSSTLPVIWTTKCKAAMSSALSGSHGLPGALAMLHLNDSLRKYPVKASDFAVSRFCVEWAAMAIMMHDMQKFYEEGVGPESMKHLRVSLMRDPLSFLMTLVDQIQDFGRANAIFTPGADPNISVALNYHVACHKVQVSRSPSSSEMLIEFCYNDKNDARLNKDLKKKDEKKFFDPTIGYLDYSALPISRIRLSAVHDSGGKW